MKKTYFMMEKKVALERRSNHHTSGSKVRCLKPPKPVPDPKNQKIEKIQIFPKIGNYQALPPIGNYQALPPIGNYQAMPPIGNYQAMPPIR